MQPAHCLTFLPPVTLTNLLPCALEYKVQDSKLRGSVRPGAEIELLVDIFGIYVVDFCLDGFPGTGSLIMQPNSGSTTSLKCQLCFIKQEFRTRHCAALCVHISQFPILWMDQFCLLISLLPLLEAASLPTRRMLLELEAS